jgi:hypothetical protein
MPTQKTELPADALRCSDAERERTAALLHAATGEGRLSIDEVEERLAKIYEARYRHELDAVTADLPATETTASGWRPIVVLVRQQLADDLAALLGRVTANRRRRVAVAITAVLLVLAVLSTIVLVLHGFGGDEAERRGFDR